MRGGKTIYALRAYRGAYAEKNKTSIGNRYFFIFKCLWIDIPVFGEIKSNGRMKK